MASFSQGFRSCNLIDVNKNHGLLSSSYRPTGEQHVLELQEQINSYKRELAKKDGMIAHLSTTSPRLDRADLIDTMIEEPLPYERRGTPRYCSYDPKQAELTAAKMKVESAFSEIRDLKSKLCSKDNYIHKLKLEIQVLNDDSSRQAALVQSLKEQMQQVEHQSGALEQITSKGSVTIQTLQRENRQAQEKVIELESRLRNHVLTKEETEQEVDTFKRKFYDAVTRIGDSLNTDTESGHLENAVEILIEKAKEVTQDQLLLQSKVQTVESALDAQSQETTTNRETISRLVAEVGKEQKNLSEASNTLERLRKERDNAVLDKESLEREIEILKDRIITNDKTWASSRDELTHTATKANMLNEEAKRLEYEKDVIKNEFKTFCESMAKILSDPYVEVIPREDAIKDRIRELSTSERDRKAQVDLLENKVSELSNELERQCELHHDSIRRARKAETSVFQQENRLHDLQSELVTSDGLRDTARNDKTKYLAFVRRMAQALRMTEVATDLAFDFDTEVLVARARQLADVESNGVLERNSSNYGNLYEKIKIFKEQLKSKDLHIELLRKKVSQIEQREQTHSAHAVDRDDAIATVQRLHRKIDKLQIALGDEKVKVARLKAQLADTNELKAVTIEQRRKINDLANSVGKLSTAKERHRQKLTSMKRDLTASEFNAGEHNHRLRLQLESVANDLMSTKTVLDETKRREKKLVDFREVIARIVGLDVRTLAVPDYEVISRLEKLIRNRDMGDAVDSALDRSLDAMGPRFRAGYEDDTHEPSPPIRYRSPSPPHYARGSERSPRRHHCRSRSFSPRRY